MIVMLLLEIILFTTQLAHDLVLWVVSPFWVWFIVLLLLRRPVRQVLIRAVIPITLIALLVWALPIYTKFADARYERFVDSEMNAVRIDSSCAELPQLIKGHSDYEVLKGKRWVQFRREVVGAPFERSEGQSEYFNFPGEAYVFTYRPTGLVGAQKESELPSISFDCGRVGRVVRMKRGGPSVWLPEHQK